MKVAIHQPEHFPYMGFFQKMLAADIFIVLDSVNYKKNNFQNRNRIKTLAGQDEWFTVSVEAKATSKHIKDVYVIKDFHWKNKLLKKIYQNLKFDASEIYEHDKLIDINMASIKWAMNKMNIKTKIIYASELDANGTKTELLIDICKKVGATEYISGPSGKNYLDINLFNEIKLEFFEPKIENNYSCLYNLLKK